MTVPNQSSWSKSGVYHFYSSPIWGVHKVYIKSFAADFSVAAPLTPPTQVSAPLIELSLNDMDALTTALENDLARKHRRAEATSSSQEERVLRLDS